MTDPNLPGALAPYRVVELPGCRTMLAGKMLADLGADVIKVEPPRGDPARFLEPFFTDPAGREESLMWRAYNRGKRGVTLDLTRDAGRAALRKLVAGADFLFEGFHPGTLARLGLDWEHLRQVNPRLVMASVTPFGTTGPYSDYRGPDIVPLALGGYMYVCGDKARAPVRVTLPQAFHHAAGAAAMGALLAHRQRQRTGRGQHVDAAAQHTYLTVAIQPYVFWDFEEFTLRREGAFRDRAFAAPLRVVYPCSDGHAVWMPMAGPVGGKSIHAVLERMKAEGFGSDHMHGLDWYTDVFPAMSREQLLETIDGFCTYFATKTKAELFQLALETSLTLAPVYTVRDIVEDVQMAERRYFESPPGEVPGLRYPGPFVHLSATPLRPGALAPTLGQHNGEVLAGELGLSAAELSQANGESAA